MRRRRRAAVVHVLIATLVAAPLSMLNAASDEDRATARELAKAGVLAAKSDDCVTAIEKLERAEAIFHAPTHLQYLARCYEKKGRLVEAFEAWRKIELDETAASGSPAFRAAQLEAKKARPALEPRLAHLVVSSAKSYGELIVRVDGNVWPSALLGVARVIDPGTHRIEATAVDHDAHSGSVSLGEGESKGYEIALVERPAASGSASASASSSASTDARIAPPIASAISAPSASVEPRAKMKPARDELASSGSTWRTIGWISASVGVVALGIGAGFGVAAKSTFDELSGACPIRNACPLQGQVATGERQQLVANTLFISGSVLALAGIGLVLFAPRDERRASVTLSVTPSLGGGSALLVGVF